MKAEGLSHWTQILPTQDPLLGLLKLQRRADVRDDLSLEREGMEAANRHNEMNLLAELIEHHVDQAARVYEGAILVHEAYKRFITAWIKIAFYASVNAELELEEIADVVNSVFNGLFEDETYCSYLGANEDLTALKCFIDFRIKEEIDKVSTQGSAD